jgi:hypothetical protein
MKKFSKSGFLLLLCLIFAGSINSYAQFDNVGSMIAAGTGDAKTLLQPYITPAFNAYGAALGGGWYNNAGTHKLGGFDFTITLNTGIIPKSDKTFEINNSDLNLLQLENPADNAAPTIAGKNTSGPDVVYNMKDGDGNVVYTQHAFTMPQGINFRFMPAPMMQLGIGLIKGTEVTGRLIPNIKVSGNEFGLWGIGGKHDIKQWIPGLKKMPIFQMSIMYGYTKMHTFINVNVDKGSIGAESLDGPDNWDNQQLRLTVKSQTANLIIGANVKVINFYGAVGFVTTKTNLKLAGDFPVVSVPDGQTTPVVTAVTDPINMEIKNKDGSITKPRFNAGFRIKMAVVTLHFDYSWANYSVLTAGLGLSFR